MTGFVLPPREKVGYLDPEVAGEGTKVIMSDGDQVSWTPPPPQPVMPDWSQIKSIRRYFNRTGLQVWPAWLYHPVEEPRLVKNAKEAAELGVCYREATNDERARYGLKTVWDWKDDSQWRPQPHGVIKFNPMKPGQGKTVIFSPPNPAIAQNELLRDLVPLVTAAVVAAIKGNGAASAPGSVDPAQWDAFLQFQAWQKTSQAVDEIGETTGNGALSLGGEDERAAWEKQAERKGIKVDRRWSLDRLKAEVEKAA